MILTYSKDIFVDLIKQGKKIHTIREDSPRRWKAGMTIQHWRGSPRNPSANPYCFAEGVCRGVEEIEIVRTDFEPKSITHGVMVRVGNRWLWDGEIELLAEHDGLTPAQFRKWFVPPGNDYFKGRIIHFEHPNSFNYEKFNNEHHFMLDNWVISPPQLAVKGETILFNPRLKIEP